MTYHRRALLLACVVPAAIAGAVAVAQVVTDDGRIGPEKRIVVSGRHLTPFGKLVKAGQFPTGGALTPNGRYYWTVSTGRGQNDARIVSVRSGRVLQTLVLPGASGGIVMDPDGRHVYVSGVHDSIDRAGQETPAGTPGKAGDVVHIFRYNPKTGSAAPDGLIGVPPPSDAPTPQSFPPTNTKKVAWPDRLAISPDGSRLLVPLNLADAAAVVDVASKRVRYVKTGHYPYGAAILRDGRRGLVSNETPGTVSVVDLDSASKVKDIQVGAHLSHPEAIAVDPKADRAYVTIANSDQVAVIDTKKLTVERTLSVELPEGLGASPVDATVTPDGSSLLVANAGTDDIAVFHLPTAGDARRSAAARRAQAVLAHEAAAAKRRAGGASGPEDAEAAAAAAAKPQPVPAAYSLVGRIPTAQYPADVEVAPASANPCGFRTTKRRHSTKRHKLKRCAKVLYVSGKGLGTGPNPNGPQPTSPDDTDDDINKTQYLPLLNIGAAGIADYPTSKGLALLTRTATAQVRPVNASAAPADTPLRPGGPIKHVFYIVRENRSYDQIMGDDARGDGDPKLTLFGDQVTPNAHAIARRFPLLDHVYANSEASIDGHFWASAAKVSDYVNKNWFQNYANRERPYDFGVYSVTWPGNGFLFDQAERQGISYFNYGEAIAGTVPLADKDRTSAETQDVAKKFANSDLGPADVVKGAPTGCYPNDASVGEDAINGQPIFDGTLPPGASPQSASRTECFRTRLATQLATDSVPAFNYLVLTNDHTQTLSAGKRTPQAMIADNDNGLGQIVDTISHSAIWKSSAIFVIEDDSQDGADHVDAHRIPAFVISPFAKQGAVVHARYDFLSVIRSMELVLGMHSLGLFDELATPMYDAFQGAASDDAPFDAIAPKIDLLAKNPSGTRGARAAARLPKGIDRASQPDMDQLLWWSAHGEGTKPPPPGPNADAKDKRILK